MRLWGRLCYSAYLLQFILITIAEPYRARLFGLLQLNSHASEIRMLFYYPIFLLLLTGASYLTYVLIERPSINVGKKLIARISSYRRTVSMPSDKLADNLEIL
jgi:peptidoglycan/LPS O-acetylase OafA/YrhL